MSAKKSKKSAKPDPAPAVASGPRATSDLTSAATPAGAVATVPGVETAWIDSTDPRKRTIGKFVLAAVWVYVAALWLLALDQTFHWGIFGPTVPPVP